VEEGIVLDADVELFPNSNPLVYALNMSAAFFGSGRSVAEEEAFVLVAWFMVFRFACWSEPVTPGVDDDDSPG
jgi:hypothetical protein